MKLNVMQAGRRLGATFILGAAFALASPATVADPITITHAQGQTTLQDTPQRAVVFDAAVLDILHVLGVEPAAVADAPMPDHLARYAGDAYPKVGTMFEPNYEAVHAIEPDLIIVAGRSAPKYRDLARLAPTIDLTVDPTDLPGSVKRNTRALAEIYGKQDEAETLLGELEASMHALHDKASDAGTGLIVLTVGGKMSAYGPGSRFGVLHDSFGITPVSLELTDSNHGQAISFEFIHKTDPDWLFVIDRDAAIGREGQSARQLLDNELIHKTRAWQNGKIVYLDAMNWYLLGSAGITSLQQNIKQLSDALDGHS